MKKVIPIVLALLVVTGVVWYFATREAPAPKAAELLPDSTLLYVGLPNFPKSREEFHKTQLYAFWQEPEVQAFLEKPLRELVGKSDSTFDALLQERVLGLLEGEVFVAVTHIRPPPIVKIGLVLGADVKQKRLEAQAYLKWLEHDLSRQFPKATATDKSYLGKTYTVWQLDDKQQTCHAFLNSLLLFTNDEDAMREVLTRFTGHAAADALSLAKNPRYQATLKQIPADHALVAFLNVERVFGMFAPLLALSPQAGGTLQKLANITSAATSVTVADDLLQDVSLVSYSGNHTPAPVIERRTLALTSPDTSLYTVQNADLAASYRNAMDAIVQSGNLAFTTNAAAFQQALSRRGLHLEDVLEKLGPELALIGVWREGARLPDLALVAELKDAAVTRPQIDTTFEALNDTGIAPSEAQSYQGETVHVWNAGDFASPSYVVTDKFFILASNADYARALLAKSKNSPPTLAGNTEFDKAMRRLPAQSSTFTYCDLRSVFGALGALARSNAQPNAFLDLGKLPKTATFTRHLTPYVSASVDTTELQTTTTLSPFGKPLTVVIGAAGIIGAAQPWLEQFTAALPIPSLGNPPARSQTATPQTPAKR